MVSYFIDGDTPEVFDTFTIRNTEGEVLSENVTVTDKSVSLGELIDMNIYASIREDYTGTATLSCGNKTVEIDLATLTPNENGLYKLSISLTSIDMAKDVTLTIDGATYKTNIKEYLEELIDASTNSYYTNIAKALLNYGAYAQEYFAEKNSDDSLLNVLPNESLSETDKIVPSLNIDDLKKYEFAATGVTEDVKFVSAALILSSKTGIKLYFTASADATVTVDGEACEKYSDRGMYYVVLNIPSPSLATSVFNVMINDGETVASTTFSVYTAIHAALSNPDTNPKLVSLLNAYAAYCATTVIPASNKIIYNVNGGILPTDAPTQPDLEKDIILPEPTKNGYAFAGWYTTETFDAGTRIYSIPAGTLSDVTVYAKFVGVISDIDWDNIDDVNVTSANPDWYLQNSAGRNIFSVTVSGDSTAKTLTDTKNGKYLLVNTADKNPTMWLYANKYGFNQVIAKEVDCVSFTFQFSLDGTANPMYTLFQLRATRTTSDASMKHNNPFMLIDGSGNIKLADNGKTARETFATLSADRITTVRLVIDFDKKQFRVYDENGNVIDTATMAIPSATGATTGQEYMKCLIQAMIYITTNKNSNGSALRIYGIQAAYTDIFAK